MIFCQMCHRPLGMGQPTDEAASSANGDRSVITKDKNAVYSWPHWPCCFSMIRTTRPGAMVVMGQPPYENIVLTAHASPRLATRGGFNEGLWRANFA